MTRFSYWREQEHRTLNYSFCLKYFDAAPTNLAPDGSLTFYKLNPLELTQIICNNVDKNFEIKFWLALF